MTLLKKISGIRGTIGGAPGNSLSPVDVVEMVAAYAQLLDSNGVSRKVVVGRDARVSGEIISNLAINTLLASGFDVIDLGLSTTPTVEMAVKMASAGGGIIFTASHNPAHWNALKLLNAEGEFISAEDGERLLALAASKNLKFADIDSLGQYTEGSDYIDKHINAIIGLDMLDIPLIKANKYKVVVDCVNSTGAISIVPLLEKLDCEVVVLNSEMTGRFTHDPEPLPKNLKQLSDAVVSEGADIGVAVDPDVDRLVLVCGNGEMFGEEYTIVAAADYVLRHKTGPTVSNMSSSRALEDIAIRHGQQHFKSAVGEVNVVEKMKQHDAAIGGEGNGGVILPELHYGRDALVGIAIILNLMASEKKSLLEIKAQYPQYEIIKRKFEIDPALDIGNLIEGIKKKYSNLKLNEEDGLRVDFERSWVHIRKSNTEPVIRLIAEAETQSEAEQLVDQFEQHLNEIK